jgi:hypothetical protein
VAPTWKVSVWAGGTAFLNAKVNGCAGVGAYIASHPLLIVKMPSVEGLDPDIADACSGAADEFVAALREVDPSRAAASRASVLHSDRNTAADPRHPEQRATWESQSSGTVPGNGDEAGVLGGELDAGFPRRIPSISLNPCARPNSKESAAEGPSFEAGVVVGRAAWDSAFGRGSWLSAASHACR